MPIAEKDKSVASGIDSQTTAKRKLKNEYVEIEPNSELLCKKSKDLNEIFSTYINLINPLIIQYEILTNEFPIEIQNEIRAIFTHLSRCTIELSENNVDLNLSKAKSHAKRAALDCYKYNCLAYSDFYHNFMHHYQSIDLSLIDNGSFLPEVTKKFYKAQSLMIEAKKYESTHTASTDELYDKYMDSYLIYHEVYQLLVHTQEKADHFLNKLTVDKNKEKRSHLIDRWIGIIGMIVGIIGVLLAIFY